MRRRIDVLLTLTLLVTYSFEGMPDSLHELLGCTMTILFIIHLALNRRWWKTIGKGDPVLTIIDLLLVCAFSLLIISGMSMNRYPWLLLPRLFPVPFSRPAHLSVSSWAFLLMGLHAGYYVNKRLPLPLFFLAAVGLAESIRTGTFSYLFLRETFFKNSFDGWWIFALLSHVSTLVWWFVVGNLEKKGVVRYRNRKRVLYNNSHGA